MFDLHIHSTYSDGQASLKDMIETAIGLGLGTFGAADHLTHNPVEVKKGSGPIAFYEMEDYFNALKDAKEEYKEKINILASVEMNYYGNDFLTCYNELMKYNPDYVLCSVHSLTDEINPWTINNFPDYKYQFVFDYLQKCIDVVNTGVLDILGHFNCYLVAGEMDESPYYKMFDELAEVCYKNNTCLEFDTAVFKESINCDPYIFKKCEDLGVSVVVDSDAHEISTLFYKFDEAFEYFKKNNINLVPISQFTKNEILREL